MKLVDSLQSLGRALMLPIAVLPVAGILLRLGQDDIAGPVAAAIPFLKLSFLAAAGGAIFDNLGLLFAAGAAVGLARENHGAASLAGVVSFLVAVGGAKALITPPTEAAGGMTGAAAELAVEAWRSRAIHDLSVPIGIVSGVLAGACYNRFGAIRLPDYLAFFGGRRFVPIAMGLVGALMALVIGASFAQLHAGLTALSREVLGAGSAGLFFYGVLNRLLIVTGLHHILNNVAWFIVGDFHGATGDLKRFFAGDPTAGVFMAGFFPVMMFGLPAACLAMYHAAPTHRRAEVAGLFTSMALTSFLTGVTEPIEFTFMFLAPALYAAHMALTGLSFVLMDLLRVKLGFSFSAGLFDYLINFRLASRPLWLIPVGLAYFAVYYGVFRVVIRLFDLKTPGREAQDPPEGAAATVAPVTDGDRAAALVQALGGAGNIVTLDACTTRLRLTVRDQAAVDEAALRRLGARGVVRPSPTALQVILGPVADQVAGELRRVLQTAPVAPTPVPPATAPISRLSVDPAVATALRRALGGADNLVAVTWRSTRLLVQVADPARVSEAALVEAGVAAGVKAVARSSDHGLQLIVGDGAEPLAAALSGPVSGG